MSKSIGFVNDFNLKKQAEELGVSVWQTPGFLFLILGAIIITIMTVVYFITQLYDSPEVLIISESVVAAVVYSVGTLVIRNMEGIERSNKLKSEFVSIASHELKTPLSEINWEVELLLSKYGTELSDKQKEIIQTIEKSSDKMTRLVKDLLEVARIDQGRMLINKKRVDVVKLLKETIEDNKPLAEANKNEIVLTVLETACPVWADERKLKVVMDNLLSNAIKYNISEKGKIEVKIENVAGQCVVRFKDNGLGILESDQDKMFQKFFRGSNAIRYKTQGTGLGLYIAKSILDQLDGKIWFNSKEHHGSTFSFSLPIAC